MSSDPRLAGLASGIINTLCLVLMMLDRKGVLSREEVIGELEAMLHELQNPPEHSTFEMYPLQHLIRALSGPDRDSTAPQNGWTPVVIPGGREDA